MVSKLCNVYLATFCTVLHYQNFSIGNVPNLQKFSGVVKAGPGQAHARPQHHVCPARVSECEANWLVYSRCPATIQLTSHCKFLSDFILLWLCYSVKIHNLLSHLKGLFCLSVYLRVLLVTITGNKLLMHTALLT